MCQIIQDVVRRDTIRQRCIILGIAGIVGPLDSVSHVPVMADPDHNPALVVVDRSKLGIEAIKLPRYAALQELRPWYARALVYIVYDVEDLLLVIKIHHRTPGKDLP